MTLVHIGRGYGLEMATARLMAQRGGVPSRPVASHRAPAAPPSGRPAAAARRPAPAADPLLAMSGIDLVTTLLAGGIAPALAAPLPPGRDLTGLSAAELMAELEDPNPVPAPAREGVPPASGLEALTDAQLVDWANRTAGYTDAPASAELSAPAGAAVDAEVAAWVAQIGGTGA